MATVAPENSARTLRTATVKPRTQNADFRVDFHTDCNLDGWIGYLLKSESLAPVRKMEQLYTQNHFAFERVIDPVRPQGIPRILHQIWFGPAIPRKYQIQIGMWKSHHPHWNTDSGPKRISTNLTRTS